MATVDTLLQVIAWGVICVLVVVLQRIARFYEITSGRRSRYQWFGMPLILLAAVVVTDALFGGEPNVLGDVLLLAGGASLIGLGYNLVRLMTGSRS
jgi:hypothetical protein